MGLPWSIMEVGEHQNAPPMASTDAPQPARPILRAKPLGSPVEPSGPLSGSPSGSTVFMSRVSRVDIEIRPSGCWIPVRVAGSDAWPAAALVRPSSVDCAMRCRPAAEAVPVRVSEADVHVAGVHRVAVVVGGRDLGDPLDVLHPVGWLLVIIGQELLLRLDGLSLRLEGTSGLPTGSTRSRSGQSARTRWATCHRPP
jgi:hypothetical protein